MGLSNRMQKMIESGQDFRPICVAMDKVAQLALSLGIEPMNKIKGCWEHQVDEHWRIIVNGHKEPVKHKEGVTVEPFSCIVFYNDLPAGIFNPFGGGFVASRTVNEDTFIKAIDNVLEKIRLAQEGLKRNE